MADFSGMRRRSGMTEDNGPQRAVDTMAAGGDANADRKKKGGEYGMGGTPDLSKARTKTPMEVFTAIKRRVMGG